VIAGSEKHTGEVFLDEHPLDHSTRARLRAGIGFVPEDRVGEAIFPSLSVERNVEVASVGSRRLAAWVGPKPSGRIAKRLDEFAVKTPSPKSPITALSGGNQQLVVLCRVLGAGPKVLVADEPTQGIDARRRTAIHDMLRAFCAGGGAVMLVMSDFEELRALASRVLVLHDGEVVAEVPPTCDEHQLIRLATGVERGVVPAALAQEAREVGHVR
jgi:ABC-type sugar transport system ATPase subunit